MVACVPGRRLADMRSCPYRKRLGRIGSAACLKSLCAPLSCKKVEEMRSPSASNSGGRLPPLSGGVNYGVWFFGRSSVDSGVHPKCRLNCRMVCICWLRESAGGHGSAARWGSYSCFETDSRPPESIFHLPGRPGLTVGVLRTGAGYTVAVLNPPVGLAATAPWIVPEAKAHTDLSADGVGEAAPQRCALPGPEAALNSVLNFAINTGTFGRTP